MAAYTTTVWDKALKPIYPRGLQTIWYEHAPTVSLLKTDTTYEGQKRIVTLVTGGTMASGNFNTAKDNRTTVTPVGFEIDVVRGYAFGSLDNLAMAKAKGDKGATGRILKTAFDAAGYGFGRRLSCVSFWGNGGGALAQVGALSVGNTVITLKNINDVVKFEVGQTLQASAADGLSGSVLAGRITITAISRDAGTLTFASDTVVSIPTLAANYYLFNDGDWGTSNAAQGLPAWNPESEVTAATTFLTVDRSVDIVRRAGSRFNANGATIEDCLIDGLARLWKNGGRPKQFIMDPLKHAEFQKNAVSRGFTMSEKKSGNLGVTYKSFDMPTPNGSLEIIQDVDCPTTCGRFLDLADWTLFSSGPVPHFDKQGSDNMLVESGADAKEFRLKAYYNFECQKPVNCGALTW